MSYGFSWAATRLRELAYLGRRAGKGWEEDDRSRTRQWHNLRDKFQNPAFLGEAMEQDGRFRDCLRFV